MASIAAIYCVESLFILHLELETAVLIDVSTGITVPPDVLVYGRVRHTLPSKCLHAPAYLLCRPAHPQIFTDVPLHLRSHLARSLIVSLAPSCFPASNRIGVFIRIFRGVTLYLTVYCTSVDAYCFCNCFLDISFWSKTEIVYLCSEVN